MESHSQRPKNLGRAVLHFVALTTLATEMFTDAAVAVRCAVSSVRRRQGKLVMTAFRWRHL